MGSNAVTVGTQIDEKLWRQEELGEEHRATKRVSVGIQTDESFLRLRDEDGDLLPGLPNDITLEHILTKLPWRAFHVLSSVRHRWLQAIRSHKVHDARIRTQSTDTLVVMTATDQNFLILYSMIDQQFYELPCIRHFHKKSRIRVPDLCVSLPGKLYVLGGALKESSKKGSREVYMMDLVEQREWRQCASMKDRRLESGYGAKDGKIYVFGGAHHCKPVRGCEVYDPEKDSWSQIAPIEFWRHSHKVANLGEELFVYGGYLFGPGGDVYQHYSRALVLDAYHPIKNEWRRVGEHPSGGVFMALGKFHVMTVDTIQVYDHENNSWSHLHSINLGGGAFDDPGSLYIDVLAINDELLVVVLEDCEYHRFRGKGLGGKDAEILFQEEAPGDFEECFVSCTIQL